MQNISAVLAKKELNYIKGYKPARNVGSNVERRILNLLDKMHLIEASDLMPTSDQAELEKRVKKLRRFGLGKKPAGVRKPKKSKTSSTAYERDPKVISWVLDEAKGHCEACGNQGPFKTMEGSSYYLEVHHVRWLAHGGSDRVENAVALCPNCHRRLHHAGRPRRRERIFIQEGVQA